MKVLVLGAAGLALAACAPYPPGTPPPAAAASPPRCFHSSQVTGYREAGPDHVDLLVGASRVFRAELFGACPDLLWTNEIGVRGRGGASYICDGIDVEFIVPSAGSGRPRRCEARSIRLLTPAEAAAPRPR